MTLDTKAAKWLGPLGRFKGVGRLIHILLHLSCKGSENVKNLSVRFSVTTRALRFAPRGPDRFKGRGVGPLSCSSEAVVGDSRGSEADSSSGMRWAIVI